MTTLIDIPGKLEKLGLSAAESLVYLCALETGPILPKHLADRTKVKRPTLYEIVPKLIEKGLFSETIQGKRKYLVAEDIEPFLERKQKELEELQEAVPHLRALLQTATRKPKILFFEGVEGVKRVYRDHLLQREEILELAGIEYIHPELQKYIVNFYIPERARRKIKLKMLVNGPTSDDVFTVRSNSLEFREVRTMEKGVLTTPLGLNIYGNTVSITLHRKDSTMIGLIIRSSEIAETLRSIFGLLWMSAQEQIKERRLV